MNNPFNSDDILNLEPAPAYDEAWLKEEMTKLVESKIAYANEIGMEDILADRDSWYIAGGSATSLLNSDPVHDVDLYFRFPADSEKARYWLLAHPAWIKEVDEKYRATVGVDGKLITDNAITLSNGLSFVTNPTMGGQDYPYTFDYLHTNIVWCNGDLICAPGAFEAAKEKKLVIQNIHNLSYARLNKFRQAGFNGTQFITGVIDAVDLGYVNGVTINE